MPNDIRYHIGFGPADIDGIDVAILCGDPERAERVAKEHLSLERVLSTNRGRNSYIGRTPGGRRVGSATSGMGAPSPSLVVNELAPRPHNSGHLTIEAAATSQFEQQLRALCGLPLGSTDRVSPAAMANLLGDLWSGGEPDWAAALAVPGVRLHLYGKTAARPGRKMGHLTACRPTVEEAIAAVTEARRRAARAGCVTAE